MLYSSVQSLSCVQLFTTPWTTARQVSLSITNSQSLLRLISLELMVPSNHLLLCHPLLLLPSILPSITLHVILPVCMAISKYPLLIRTPVTLD